MARTISIAERDVFWRVGEFKKGYFYSYNRLANVGSEGWNERLFSIAEED